MDFTYPLKQLPSPAATLLTLIGGYVALKALYRTVSYLSLICGPSTTSRLIHSPKSYALVTGASDGLGRATALELYKRGFNIILHGRNEDKLRKMQAEMQQKGVKDVRIWVQNAGDEKIDFEAAVKQWDDLEITLVVNNVGIAFPEACRSVSSPHKDT